MPAPLSANLKVYIQAKQEMKGNKTRNGYVVYSTIHNVEKKLFLQKKKGLRNAGKKIKKVKDLEEKGKAKNPSAIK